MPQACGEGIRTGLVVGRDRGPPRQGGAKKGCGGGNRGGDSSGDREQCVKQHHQRTGRRAAGSLWPSITRDSAGQRGEGDHRSPRESRRPRPAGSPRLHPTALVEEVVGGADQSGRDWEAPSYRRFSGGNQAVRRRVMTRKGRTEVVDRPGAHRLSALCTALARREDWIVAPGEI